MVFDGKIWKDGKWWVVHIPALDLSTQGTSRKDALHMAGDAVETLVEKKGFHARATLTKNPAGESFFILSSNDEAALVALFLRRQRAANKLSVRQLAKRLGYKSPSAYAQYETGKHIPGLDKLARFIQAMNPHLQVSLGLVAA